MVCARSRPRGPPGRKVTWFQSKVVVSGQTDSRTASEASLLQIATCAESARSPAIVLSGSINSWLSTTTLRHVPFVWGKQNSRAQTEEFFTREREKIQSIWKFYYTRTCIGYVVKYVASDNCFCEKREKFLRLAMPTNLPHEFIHWELCQIQSTKNRRLSSSVRKYRVTYRLGT